MSDTLVLGLDTREQQPVQLRTPGFESSVVRCPTLTDDSVERFLRCPARASACAFVTELLAVCLAPARRPREVAALPESDRARLRLALVAASGREREWRKLRGSHLTADERLMALMVWRRQDQERLFKRLRERRRELAVASKVAAGELAPQVKVPVGALGRAVTSMVEAQKMLMPMCALSDYSMSVKPLTPFPNYCAELLDPVRLLGVTVGLAKSVHVGPSSLMFGGVNVLPPSPDPAMTTAARLVRDLYTDPSPLVVALAGGPNSFIWSELMRTGLALGAPAWMETVRTMSDGLLGMQTVQALGDAGRGVVSSLKLDPEAAALLRIQSQAALWRMPVMPGLVDLGETLQRYIRAPLWEFPEEWEEADRFMERWERQALWYLLSQFGLHALLRLAKLGRAEVEEVLLQALEAVVTDGEVVPALRTAVANAPHLDRFPRGHLDHALEQAEKGSYIPASGSLYPGLEGAFGEVGCARALITPERKWADQPKKAVNFETMVKRLGLDDEFELFIVTAVFGDVGNRYRHGYGDATRGVRRQVLFGIAVLAGWLQEFAGVSALDVLSARMAKALPAAVETVTRLALPAGGHDSA